MLRSATAARAAYAPARDIPLPRDVPRNVVHRSGFFVGTDGTVLFERHWEPHAEPLADIILVHGLYDHCSRYSRMASRLVDQRFAVHSYDLRGHAHSEGVRGDFRLAEHCADLETYVQRLRRRRRTKRLFLVGNAIGGLIALAYVMSVPTLAIDSMAVIAPAPRVERALPLRARLASLLRSDACVVEPDFKAGCKDPLIHPAGITRGAAAEIAVSWQFVLEGAPTLRVPLFLLQGTLDRMTDPREALALYARVRSHDKRMRMYPGLAHDLLRQPARERIVHELSAWFEERMVIRCAG
ncbi:lysophospholipase [Pendulispora rubella]|uniref:Lysophospholipase n=1 Tax=Pendulispora rubella TaxID=2741070 RepID=A0ABZ2KY20_9BACT